MDETRKAIQLTKILSLKNDRKDSIQNYFDSFFWQSKKILGFFEKQCYGHLQKNNVFQ